MNQITTIEELISLLDDTNTQERAEIVAKLDLNSNELKQYSTWEENGYTRNCLARSKEYEIILLCWDQKAATPIHGHGGQDCWVYQVDGDVLEIRFANNERGDLEVCEKLLLGNGDISYMTDEMGYHLIKNNSKKRAMTLHIYAGPIDACEVFCTKKNGFKLTEMAYDEYFDEVISG